MRLVRAKNKKNKAEVIDNRPFMIEDIELYGNGFRIVLLDIYAMNSDSEFEKIELWYRKREWFDEEWELINSIDYSICSFDLINYYQE